MSHYILNEDITANIAKGFQLEAYLTECDYEIEDLAEKLGVRDPEDIADPIHYKIKRYGIAFILMRLSQDKMGTNNVEISELDKYTLLYNVYTKELAKLKSEISKEMVLGQVTHTRDRAVKSGLLFRG